MDAAPLGVLHERARTAVQDAVVQASRLQRFSNKRDSGGSAESVRITFATADAKDRGQIFSTAGHDNFGGPPHPASTLTTLAGCPAATTPSGSDLLTML